MPSDPSIIAPSAKAAPLIALIDGLRRLSRSASPVLSPDAARRLRRQQLEGVHRHVIRAAVINSSLAAVLASFLAPTFGWTTTHIWLVVKLTVSLVRVGAAFAYGRPSALTNREGLARQTTLVLLAVDGAVWGAAGAWCAFGPSEIACLTCAVLCSVALMATHGFSRMASASLAYVVSMLAPLAMAVAMRGDALGAFVAIGTVLVLLQSIVTSVASEKRLQREFVAHEDSEQARIQETRNGEALAAALLEVRKQAAVKSLFLGTMSHELRTPLHGILGLTELIRKQTSENAIVQHHLDLLEASGTHLVELIGSLLDISRIEAGRLELHNATFDLAVELRNVADLYQVRCDSKGLEFSSSIRIESPCYLYADAARLRQVLHNLLGNAVKFTKAGLIVLKVYRQGELFSFEVRDTGPGIAPSDASNIFDAFRQADDSATRPADGTGLGLTIAREIARALGGDITVSSAVGFGSQFTFTAVLPRGDQQRKSDEPRKASLPQLRQEFRVVLVEDNEVNALIATAHLTGVGAQVIRAHDGTEAVLSAFARPRPDFILMDCRMPVMDGLTATREIRAIEKRDGVPCVPIVALTASPTEEDKRECQIAGMDGVLAKPFTLEQLLQVITLHASSQLCDRNHPLYEYAKSLDDSGPDSLVGVTVH